MDVNVYASNPKHARSLIGNHENTEVGNFLSDYLDLDLESVTQELKDKSAAFDTDAVHGEKHSWMGQELAQDIRINTDHYQGDFKRSLDCGHVH